MSVPPPSRGALSPPTLVLIWFSQWILWFTFADSSGFRELLIGSVAAAVGTYLVEIFAANSGQSFHFQAHDAEQAFQIPKLLFCDTGILLLAITRRVVGQKLSGGIVSVRFRTGGDDPTSHARRALAITFLTLTPNTLVLGIDKNAQLLFFHTVIRRPLPKFLEEMGARTGQSS